MMSDVDLSATPRAVNMPVPLPMSDLDATLCNAVGIYLFKGSQYYRYETPMILAMSRMTPRPLPVTNAMLGCRD